MKIQFVRFFFCAVMCLLSEAILAEHKLNVWVDGEIHVFTWKNPSVAIADHTCVFSYTKKYVLCIDDLIVPVFYVCLKDSCNKCWCKNPKVIPGENPEIPEGWEVTKIDEKDMRVAMKLKLIVNQELFHIHQRNMLDITDKVFGKTL